MNESAVRALLELAQAEALSNTEFNELCDGVVPLAEDWLRKTEALKEIARHQVASAESSASPCDWHCTATMRDLARAVLVGVDTDA